MRKRAAGPCITGGSCSDRLIPHLLSNRMQHLSSHPQMRKTGKYVKYVGFICMWPVLHTTFCADIY